MKCKIISPKSKTTSILGDQLVDVFNIKDLDFLKQKFSIFESPKFIERFGDWINKDGEAFRDRVNSLGEPYIEEDEFGNFYVLDKDYNKLPINNRRFSGLEQLGIKELTNFKNEVTSQIAAFIFDKHIKNEDFSDITEIRFNLSKEIDEFFDSAVERLPAKYKEEGKTKYNFLKEYNKDWKLEVEDFFKSKSLEYSDLDDLDENAQIDNEENGLGVDLKPSVEKNSKDNATAKIKLLLSFLPEVDANNKIKYGNYVIAPKLLSFNQVWYDLEKELKDIPQVLKGDKVVDPFEVMADKIKALSTRKPYLKALLSKLKSVDTNTQTQFVNTFANNTIYDFDTVEVTGKERARRFTRINAAETSNKSNKLLGDWGLNFQRNFITSLENKDVFDASKFSNIINKDLTTLKQEFEAVRRLVLRNKQVSDNKQVNLSASIQNSVDTFIKVMNKFGIVTTDQSVKYFLSDMGEISTITEDSFLRNMRDYLNGFDHMVNSISKSPVKVFKKGIFINPYLEAGSIKQTVITDLAKANAFFNQEISENTLMAADKILWKYNLSSHNKDKINIWKNDDTELKKIAKDTNSLFAKLLTEKKDKLNSLDIKMTSTLQEQGKAAEGTDNTSTSEVDALNRDIFEVLGHKAYGGMPTYQTPTPADKSTAFKLKIDHFIDSGARENEGEFKINTGTLNVFVNYLEDENNRAVKAKNDIIDATNDSGEINTEDLIQYFHANKNGYVLEIRHKSSNELLGETNNSNSARQIADEVGGKVVFGGNAFKSMIAPSLSFDRINKEHPNIPIGTFHKTTGEPITSLDKFTPTQREILKKELTSMLQVAIKDTIRDAREADIIDESSNNLNIDINIWNKYKGNVISLFGDYVINSMIAQVEYAKLFSGDLAMHKNIVDYFKRIPGTYISGKGLRLGIEPNDHKFNITVLNDMIVDSEYLKDMPGVSEYYKGINQADAQAYISPKRWRFIMERLGNFSFKQEAIYNKMIANKPLTPKEIKTLSAQPIKGVYRSLINGRPVYLKYSQVVLLPTLTGNTPLDNLRKKMESQGIDEAVMNSGIKVGANIVSGVSEKILNGEDVPLSKIELDNRFWKLQQDLPSKLFKDTLVGSQLQKNIFNKLDFTKDYGGINGKEIYKQLHNTVSALSDMGRAEIIAQLEIGSDFTIRDWSSFTSTLVSLLKEQGMDNNVVKAVEKELSPYVLPQARTKVLNTIFSTINKKTVKIKTNGASLIQMSNYGLDYKDASKEGVFWLKDPQTLAEPRLIKDIDGNKKVLSGQVFIPATFISKYIPNWRDYTAEQLFGENGMVDKRALNLIGYRIPNQGTSSNDALEVVGILPEGYADTIVTYTGITTKTGSDFDIDKMFIMAPHLQPKFKADPIKFLKKNGLTNKIAKNLLKKNGYYNYNRTNNIKLDPVEELYGYIRNNEGSVTDTKLKEYITQLDKWIAKQPDVRLDYIEYNEEDGIIGNGKKALQNRLVELYQKVLLSEHNYEALMTPLDYPFMEEDIKGLYNLDNKKLGNLEMISPFYQIKLKYQFLAGRFGIGQVANQLVDHMRGQTAPIKLGFNLGWGNTVQTDNGPVTIFDVNRDGENVSESVNGLQSFPIDQSISAILNAFVDIAKDPYITSGNWNTLTTNMGLMLIRAGVHPFKVNAFVGQPAIKRIAKETFSREGKLRLLDKPSADIIPNLLEEYETKLKEFYTDEVEFETLLKQLYSKDYLKIEVDGNTITNRIQYRSIGELRRNIKDTDFQSDPRFYIDQILAIKEYGNLVNLAKEFRLGVSSSKFGESGAGVTPTQLMITKNNLGSIFYKNKLKDFQDKFIHPDMGVTSLGTYFNNTVGLMSGIIESNPKLFLTSTEYFRKVFNSIAEETHSNSFYLNDEKLARILDDSTYSAILSGFEAFNVEDKKDMYNDLFRKLYDDIATLKKGSNNFLLKELELKKDGKFRFIGINGARQKPAEYNNKITDAWLDLANSNKELSDRLVKYAYFQSGFRNNINAIFKYIPHEFFIENNLDSYINYVSKDIHKTISVETLKDQMYRHNWDDSRLVPVISNKDIAKAGKTKKVSEDYVILNSNSEKYTGISIRGNRVFPPFMSRFFTPTEVRDGQFIQGEPVKLLYKLDGYQFINQSVEPVYIKTHKLGYKSNKGQFHEYDLTRDLSESIYVDNNVSDESRVKQAKVLDIIREKRPYVRLDEFDYRNEDFTRNYIDLPNITNFERVVDPIENNEGPDADWTAEDNESENPLDC